MAEEIRKSSEDKKTFAWGNFWWIVLFSFGSSILREMGVYPSIAWIGWGTVVNIVSYWLPPNPKESFIKWFVTMETLLIGFVVIVWFIPKLLREIIPIFLAYGLPALVFFMSIYFIPPLQGNKKRSGFLKWVIGCCIFALLFGWFISITIKN